VEEVALSHKHIDEANILSSYSLDDKVRFALFGQHSFGSTCTATGIASDNALCVPPVLAVV
jgi:hypothetical protein